MQILGIFENLLSLIVQEQIWEISNTAMQILNIFENSSPYRKVSFVIK